MPSRPVGANIVVDEPQPEGSPGTSESQKLPELQNVKSKKSRSRPRSRKGEDDRKRGGPRPGRPRDQEESPDHDVQERNVKGREVQDRNVQGREVQAREVQEHHVKGREVQDGGAFQAHPVQTRARAAPAAASDESPLKLDVNPLVRYPLLLFNMALCFVGGGMMALGLYAIIDSWDYSAADEETLKKNRLQNLGLFRLELVVTIAGLVLLFGSCFGCIGALRENLTLLRVYSGLLTLLSFICLILGLIVLLMPASVKTVVQDTLSDSLVVHYRDTPDNQLFVDAVQRYLKCCGMSGNFRDWNRNIYFNCSSQNPGHERCSVPFSCCKRNSTHEDVSVFCGRQVLNMSDNAAWHLVYVGSCPDAAHRFIKANVMLTGGVCLVLVIALTFVDMVTGAVIDEIKAIRKIYFAAA